MATKKNNDTVADFEGVEELGFASTGNVDWSVFLEEGVIVTLTIKRYRGVTSVDFSELGIDDSSDSKLKSFLSDYIQLGNKKLIPPEIEGRLKSIETTARQNLTSKSFDCSAFASTGKFVPKSVYSEFKEVNEEMRDRFFEVRDDFAADYDNIIEQVRKDYKVLAEKLYMQSHPDAKKPSTKYVNSFVDKIIGQIPSADEIVASFEYSTMLRRIPDYLLNAIRKKNNIDERVMRIAATNQAPAEAETSKTSPTKTSKKDEKPVKGENSAEVDEVLDELDRDINESIADQSQGMVSDFVTGILLRLRTMAYEGSDSIVNSIEKNDGKLVGRASMGAHSLVKDLKEMNFYGDTELDEMVDKLAVALGTDKAERDIEEVKQAALELRTWSEKSMNSINTQAAKAKSTKAPKRTTSKRSTSNQKKSKGGKVMISAPRGPRTRRSIKQRT